MDDSSAGAGTGPSTGPGTGPGAGGDAGALADELTRVRGRGLNEVDEVRGRPGANGRQDALRLPELDRLRVARGVSRGSRALDLRVLLWDGLADFGREFPGDAAVIRSLYFDEDGRPPPPRGASQLLRRARGDASESSFRRRQRGLLERFAAFLLTRDAGGAEPVGARAAVPGDTAPEVVVPEVVVPEVVVPEVIAPETVAPDVAPPESVASEDPARSSGSRSRLRGAGVVVLVVAAAVLLTLLVSDLVGASGTPSANDEEGVDTAVSVPIRFNALGGTTSRVIDLYDDPDLPREESMKTATYLDGQASRASCLTRGRTVTSDVAHGEEGRSSDWWLLVDGPPDVTAYATLTYLDVDPDDLARLPACA